MSDKISLKGARSPLTYAEAEIVVSRLPRPWEATMGEKVPLPQDHPALADLVQVILRLAAQVKSERKEKP